MLPVVGPGRAWYPVVMKARDELRQREWPVLLALAAVVGLSTGLMIYDISRDLMAEGASTQLVFKAMRSVTLADDLRRQAHSLTGSAAERDAATARIAADIASYDPLATYPGERGEWIHLKQLLQQIPGKQDPPSESLVRDIDVSLDRIVALNGREATGEVAEILSSFHEDYTVNAIGATIIIILAFVIGTALHRSIRLQRTLLATHLSREEERRRDLEAFAGHVAHDLRATLGPIRTCADLFATSAGPPPKDLGARVARATDRMAAIIDDLLTLSISGRPGAGQTDVAPVVAQVLEEAGPQLAGAKVEVAIEDGQVCCPPVELGRIVQNLVSNAVKYRSPERPLELGVTAKHVDSIVELVVSDNGIGMDEATAARAFDPLFRGSAAGKIPGHGLGLAIVKRTVEALGGSCSIASKPGSGTQITIRLPAVVQGMGGQP
ncbi:MAG: Phytochrome, two-component sensor histidine kinase [Deltaproteobacteria bacterium]|nr:Phytochrome, two-component sensor histidine kinase [Deltaproteobacteria bacterium]